MNKLIKCSMLCILVLSVLAFSGCGNKQTTSSETANKDVVLNINAGTGLKSVLDPLSAEFTKRTEVKVEIAYLCSAMVISNMQLTKTGDILIPGDRISMDLAVEKKVIDPVTIKDGGYMIPVIAVQKGNPKNIQSLDDMAKPGISVGIGQPESVSVGMVAEVMLKENGLYDAVKKNISLEAGSATKLIAPVAMGNLDACINWISVANDFGSKVDYINIDTNKYKMKYTVAPIGITTYSKNKKWAEEFINFATSPEGKAMFNKYGYGPSLDLTKAEEVKGKLS
jgi:molybdate transport system substrate-binding protein